MVAHGAATFLKERLFDMSDPYQIKICGTCGMQINKIDSCNNCSSSIHSAKVNIPYAAKLLFQDLTAMGLKVQMKTD